MALGARKQWGYYISNISLISRVLLTNSVSQQQYIYLHWILEFWFLLYLSSIQQSSTTRTVACNVIRCWRNFRLKNVGSNKITLSYLSIKTVVQSVFAKFGKKFNHRCLLFRLKSVERLESLTFSTKRALLGQFGYIELQYTLLQPPLQ